MTSTAQKLAGKSAAGQKKGRVAHLSLASVDVWSALRLSFFVSLGLAAAGLIAVFLLWILVERLGLFNSLDSLFSAVGGNNDQGQATVKTAETFNLGRIMGLASLASVVGVVMGTFIGGLLALLYNAIVRITGGLKVTFTNAN